MRLYADLVVAENQHFYAKFFKFYPLDKNLLIVHKTEADRYGVIFHKFFDYTKIQKITLGGDY